MSDARDAAHDAPRYSDAAGVENHPQVTDFVPRRYRTIAMLVLAGVLSTAAMAALHYFAVPISAAAGFAYAGQLDLAVPGGLASWIAASVLSLAAVYCLVIYAIRRHRIDDYRGRYRVWVATAAACVLLSANSVAGLHDIFAQSLSHHTGWTALRAGAIWWLLLAGLPLSWITFRTLLDVKECRLAGLLLVGTICCYIAGALSFLGMIPATDPRMESLTTGAATMFANWLLLTAIVSYARFVVLDAQDLVPVIRRATKPRESRKNGSDNVAASSAKPAAKATSLFAAAGLPRPKSTPTILPAKSPASSAEWVDGSRAERDPYDDDSDDDDPKMSKSERKRLRKLKARDRAA